MAANIMFYPLEANIKLTPLIINKIPIPIETTINIVLDSFSICCLESINTKIGVIFL